MASRCPGSTAALGCILMGSSSSPSSSKQAGKRPHSSTSVMVRSVAGNVGGGQGGGAGRLKPGCRNVRRLLSPGQPRVCVSDRAGRGRRAPDVEAACCTHLSTQSPDAEPCSCGSYGAGFLPASGHISVTAPYAALFVCVSVARRLDGHILLTHIVLAAAAL